eukprot:8311927-Pyramimonas_sp.AAC.2
MAAYNLKVLLGVDDISNTGWNAAGVCRQFAYLCDELADLHPVLFGGHRPPCQSGLRVHQPGLQRHHHRLHLRSADRMRV